MIRKTILLAAAALVFSFTTAHAGEVYDGNLWATLTPFEKNVFTAGLLTGISVGGKFCVDNFFTGADGLPQACFVHFHSTYRAAEKEYLAGISQIRIREALDAFYAGPENRGVEIKDAFLRVLNGLSQGPAPGSEEKTFE